jgi:hypothetical protein
MRRISPADNLRQWSSRSQEPAASYNETLDHLLSVVSDSISLTSRQAILQAKTIFQKSSETASKRLLPLTGVSKL